LIAYWIGRRGFLARLPGRGGVGAARCEQLFARRGPSTVFIARLLPLARTFVSLPAGHVGVPLVRFIVLTVAGCAIWSTCFVLAGALARAGRGATAHGERGGCRAIKETRPGVGGYAALVEGRGAVPRR